METQHMILPVKKRVPRDETQWHPVFVIWPRRITTDHIALFERIERRFIPYTGLMRPYGPRGRWEYRPRSA